MFLYLPYKPYYHLDKEEDFGSFAHNFPASGSVRLQWCRNVTLERKGFRVPKSAGSKPLLRP